MLDMAIITEERFVTCDPHNAYAMQVLYEESLLLDGFQKAGVKAARLNWADPSVDWSKIGSALFRSPWNYHMRLSEFQPWLERTKLQTRFINAYEIVKWNLDKRYLLELQKKNINIVPTVFVENYQSGDLEELFTRFNAQELVVKPLVAAGGKETYRLARNDIEAFEGKFANLVSACTMLAQPFQPSVMSQGEISLIVIGGTFTHAIRKTPGTNEFRIHEKFGGRVVFHEATAQEKTFAQQVVAACPGKPAYARVDVVYDTMGMLAVMEVELFEPELFFRFDAQAAKKLVEAVLSAQ